MDSEFNNLDYSNTNITFSATTNNIATSDETKADPIYQRQMGTNFSRAKKVGKAITIAGVTLAFTAIALSTGSVLQNVFVLNPPSVSSPSIVIENNELKYTFTISNKREYQTTYYLVLDGETVLEKDGSESTTYSGSYSPITEGAKYKFYVRFTNSLDYYKTIYVKTGTI